MHSKPCRGSNPWNARLTTAGPASRLMQGPHHFRGSSFAPMAPPGARARQLSTVSACRVVSVSPVTAGCCCDVSWHGAYCHFEMHSQAQEEGLVYCSGGMLREDGHVGAYRLARWLQLMETMLPKAEQSAAWVGDHWGGKPLGPRRGQGRAVRPAPAAERVTPCGQILAANVSSGTTGPVTGIWLSRCVVCGGGGGGVQHPFAAFPMRVPVTQHSRICSKGRGTLTRQTNTKTNTWAAKNASKNKGDP